MFLERKTELLEKCISLLVCLGGCHESDFHTVNARVLVHVDLREDDLLLEAEGIVAISVKLLGNTVEVADTREGDADEPLEELVHLDVAESNLHSDRLALAEVEVGDIFP